MTSRQTEQLLLELCPSLAGYPELLAECVREYEAERQKIRKDFAPLLEQARRMGETAAAERDRMAMKILLDNAPPASII